MIRTNKSRRKFLANSLTLRYFFGAAGVLFLLSLSFGCHEVKSGQVQRNSETFTFLGTLEKLAPGPVFASGVMAVFRLAKYRVEDVCEGQYNGTEIIVDQPIFTAKEFDGINVGDRVCVTVSASSKIMTRYDAEGIRSPSDDVKTFYIAEKAPKLSKGSGCADKE